MRALLKKNLFVLFVCMGSVGYAQFNVAGYIRDADSTPVVNATILLHDISLPNRPLVVFATSNDRGYYNLNIENKKPSYLLTVRAPSYQTIEMKLEIPDNESSVQKDFILYSSVSYLDTVKVDVRISINQTGDTITFNPEAFMLKNETNLEDLLKRLPGMEVRENGEIYFNGRRISSVLIDGDDLFRDEYKLLTQNAAPKIVERVQVIKNYKKDQLLKEFNRPGDQVINLRIKDQYKNYLFGNATAGYGNAKNKVGDLFLIKLGTSIKTQAGVNYNTIGADYNSGKKLYITNISQNSSPFFVYSPAAPLLSVSRYHYANIPDYYQNRNESIRINFNTLFKKKDWETLVNAAFSKDKLKNNQDQSNMYPDGTFLFKNDTGTMTDYYQEYSVTSSKSTKTESIYFNAALKNSSQEYGLNTASNHALETMQKLKGNNTDWQLNLNYNRKISDRTQWSNTMGYFNQNSNNQLNTSPDFLFWLFPDDVDMYNLLSQVNITLRNFKVMTNFFITGKRTSHELTGFFSSEKRIVSSGINAKNEKETAAFFNNNDGFNFADFSFRYSGSYQLSSHNKITLKLSNDPQILNGRNPAEHISKLTFYYDYSLGLSRKKRNSTIGISAGTKRQPQNHNLFFSHPVQSDFHRLLSGRIDSFGTRSSYLQSNYSLFSLKLGWIAFFTTNFSRNENKYVRSVETNGIGTMSSYIYLPNSTNQLFFLFNSQKTLGAWPFSLNSNFVYNTQGDFNSVNGKLSQSTLRFLNATMGIKSSLESIINVDYNFSLLNSRNKAKLTGLPDRSSNTLLNKMHVYLTPRRLFNTTITYYNLTTNGGGFKGNFLDLKINKKFMKEKCIVEFNLRNILNNKYISTTVIGSYYTQENKVEIRGRAYFFTLRYEFR